MNPSTAFRGPPTFDKGGKGDGFPEDAHKEDPYEFLCGTNLVTFDFYNLFLLVDAPFCKRSPGLYGRRILYRKVRRKLLRA